MVGEGEGEGEEKGRDFKGQDVIDEEEEKHGEDEEKEDEDNAATRLPARNKAPLSLLSFSSVCDICPSSRIAVSSSSSSSSASSSNKTEPGSSEE